MSEHRGVLICGELSDGGISSVTSEMLGCGRRLADELKEELACVLIGDDVGKASKEAIASGAEKVYAMEDVLFKEYIADAFVPGIQQLVEKISPRILLLGQTNIGRDLGPRLAFRLGCGLTMDCIELEIDSGDGHLKQTKPVYGGIAFATYVSEGFPQMATVRQKAMTALDPDDSREGEVIPFKVEIEASRIRTALKETVEEEIEGVKLEDAPVIVSGGRGIGSAEGFGELEKLADLFHGAVGASRPACDSAWMPETAQVGLTGKIVSPDIYIAVGISGASQHLTGCSGSKSIIAINRDEEATIFKVAKFGVVGDWKQVLPAFTQRIKELVA